MESAGFRLVVIVRVDIFIISQGSSECYTVSMRRDRSPYIPYASKSFIPDSYM